MIKITPRTIVELYPYQFSEKNIGVSIFKGWFPTFYQLCIDVDNELGVSKSDFYWVQVKEKFGAARFYYSMKYDSPDVEGLNSEYPLSTRISRIVDKASAETAVRCIVCGASTQVKMHRMGGYQALCDEHASMVKYGKTLPPYHCNPGDEPKGW